MCYLIWNTIYEIMSIERSPQVTMKLGIPDKLLLDEGRFDNTWMSLWILCGSIKDNLWYIENTFSKFQKNNIAGF